MKRNILAKPHLIGSWILKLTMINILLLGGCDAVDDLIQAEKDLPDIALLNGEWLRLSGDDESADGMKVFVSDGSSTILDPSTSSFSPGADIWKSITPSDKDLFEHQELGSDGNYYSATIKLINDDKIEINVGASGSSDIQKWVRASEDNEHVKLQGLWFVANSNGTYIIEVKGGTGRVVISTGPSFSIGDIIWKNIESDDTNGLTLLELGSDGKYSTGTIAFDSAENKIQIDIGSGNPTNFYRWRHPWEIAMIQGNWIRVDDNNPAQKNMKVFVQARGSRVVDKAQSNFKVGDTKWELIQERTEGGWRTIDKRDIGRVLIFITMVDDNTMDIGIEGQAVDQRWERAK